MNALADDNKIEALTYRINGGYTNLEDRRAEFRKAWSIWGRGAAPEELSKSDNCERGDRGARVQELLGSLHDLGYLAGGGLPIFGNKTYAAVYRFQQEHGLPPTGVVTPDTWQAIDQALVERRRSPPAPGAGTAWDAHDLAASVPRPREVVLMRGVRVFAAALAVLAAAFGLMYLMSLSRPEHFGALAIWLPLVFAALVFIGAYLIAQWGATIASSPSYDLARARAASPPRAHLSAAQGDPEPVRLGTALSAEDKA